MNFRVNKLYAVWLISKIFLIVFFFFPMQVKKCNSAWKLAFVMKLRVGSVSILLFWETSLTDFFWVSMMAMWLCGQINTKLSVLHLDFKDAFLILQKSWSRWGHLHNQSMHFLYIQRWLTLMFWNSFKTDALLHKFCFIEFWDHPSVCMWRA